MDLIKYYPIVNHLLQEYTFTSYTYDDHIYDKYSDMELSGGKMINGKVHGTYRDIISSLTYNRGNLIKYESKTAKYYHDETGWILELKGYNRNEDERTFILKIEGKRIINLEEISDDYHVSIPHELRWIIYSNTK